MRYFALEFQEWGDLHKYNIFISTPLALSVHKRELHELRDQRGRCDENQQIAPTP